jgi:hypothetical protein
LDLNSKYFLSIQPFTRFWPSKPVLREGVNTSLGAVIPSDPPKAQLPSQPAPQDDHDEDGDTLMSEAVDQSHNLEGDVDTSVRELPPRLSADSALRPLQVRPIPARENSNGKLLGKDEWKRGAP